MLPNLADCERIVFFTGAGLSAESGIPTYRGKGGIWQEYNYEEFACQRAFDRQPEKVWDFHDARRQFVSRCQPSEGHELIAEIGRIRPEVSVVTQNIDGLHQRAGSRNVIELHGSLWRVRCSAENIVFENHEIPVLSRKCSCGAYLRPDIVWFEDPLNQDAIFKALEVMSRCDILVSIGTSGMVYPAAQLPIVAIRRGVPCVEINQEKTIVSDLYPVRLHGPASSMLKRLWRTP
ncbi:NAD-dependent deacylase [bacterium]|nr:NAD-dependent deacylase [candidate division CSSED10-310 bacterium]